MKKTSVFGILLMSLSLFSCKVGPDYRRPCIPTPEQWNNEVEGDYESLNLEWWRQFGDPVLVELIQIALKQNQDLLVAVWRVQEFFGYYQVAYGQLFPLITGDNLWGKERVSTKLTPLLPGIKNPDYIHSLFFNGGWEIDLWGKLRREVEARWAEVLSAEQARRSVIQTLVAAVASGYITLLHLDRQLEISLETANSRRRTLDLFKRRYQAGVISRINLSQIESEYQDAEARIPEFSRSIAESENALCSLLGMNPRSIFRGGTIDDLKFPTIPISLPSALLCNRPDIITAEENLIAANARIGVARAQYFPAVSLTGAYGNASLDLQDLFKADARAWSYFVPVSVPIFTAGRIAGEVHAAEAVKEERLATYRQTIINAFVDVEDALVDVTETRLQLEAEYLQVQALQTYARLSRMCYDEGYTSYLEVLDAERSLFSVQIEYTQTHGAFFLTAVNLYKSLGGGWINAADAISEK